MAVRRHIDVFEDPQEPVTGEIVADTDQPVVRMQEHEQATKEVALIQDQALIAQFAEMATAIPASSGNGTEDILRQLLNAATWEDLNRPWNVGELTDVVGKKLILVSATRRPSSFQSGLRMMLVLTLQDPDTGKEFVKPTSAVSIIGQTAWLYFHGKIPSLVEWVVADRPTQDGYYPQHLTIHAYLGAVKTSAEQVTTP